MELKKAVYGRRSAKKFKNKSVPLKLINQIIEHGMQSPTACNIQGWKFIIVDNDDLKDWFVDSGSPPFIKQAPVGILVLYDSRSENTEYKDYIQSGAAAIQNMLLAAHSFGLGACWVCRLPSQEDIRNMLNIPKLYDILAYVAIGYPDMAPRKVPRKYKLNEAVSKNTFKGIVTKSTIKRKIKLLIPRPLKLFIRLCLDGSFLRKLK